MLLSINERSLYYKKTGRGSIAIVLVHGGPGLTLDSLAIIHDLLPEEEYTVISYNQSGSANNENAPKYNTTQQYAEELHEVIQALEIKNPFLFGHSWGGAIVQEFLWRFPTYKIRGIILSNSFPSGKKLKRAIQKRIDELPNEFRLHRKKCLEENDGAAYQALLGEWWMPTFVCRKSPMPNDIATSLASLAPEVYTHFVGADLLNISGALLDWDRTNELGNISIPTLVMSGGYDYPSRNDFNDMVKNIPNATRWYDEETSHFPMYENPLSYKDALITFMKSNHEV